MNQTPIKILVIDDDSSMLELTRINLEKLGYAVVVAQNAETGHQFYQQALEQGAAFDAAIIDLRLGGAQHGTGVATDLLALHPEARLIVSSGDSNNPAMVNYQDYGFKARLEKDFNRENMRQTILSVLQKS